MSQCRAILFQPHSRLGGVEKLMDTYSTLLTDAGYSVSRLSGEPGANPDVTDSLCFPMYFRSPLLTFLLNRAFVKKVCIENDLVIIAPGKLFFIMALFPNISISKMIVVTDSLYPDIFKRSFGERLLKPLVMRLFRRAKLVTSPTAFAQSAIATWVPAARTACIPHPIDSNEIRRLGSEAISPPTNKKFVVVAARLISMKNVDRAIKGIYSCSAPVDLVVVGDGPLLASLKDLDRELSIINGGKRVHFVGWRSNPYPFMKQAIGVLSLAQHEAFGLTPVEGLFFGTPFIAVDSLTKSLSTLSEVCVNCSIIDDLSPEGIGECIAKVSAMSLRDRESNMKVAEQFDVSVASKVLRSAI